MTPNPNRRLAWSLAPALLGWLVLAPPAFAADPEDGSADVDGERYTAEDVLYVEGTLSDVAKESSIATKIPLDLHLTPASVSVVTSTLFADQGGRVLGDALENAAGVNVQTQSGVADYFLIRGFDILSSGLVLTDGVSEPEVTFYHLYNVDRVEVLRGPAAFLYGGNTLSGAASLVRKQPASGSFLEVRAGGGSFGTFGGVADVNHASRDGRLAFRLNAFWEDSDGFRDGKQSDVLAVNPAFTWQIGDRSSLSFNAEVVSSDYQPDGGLPLVFGLDGSLSIPDVPRERSYDAPFDFSNQDVTRLRLDYRYQVNDRLELRNKTYFTSLDWQSVGTQLSGAFPLVVDTIEGPFVLGRLVARFQTGLDDRQEFFGNQTEAVLTLDGGRFEHQLVAGVELERRTDDFRLDVGLLPLIDLDDPQETAPGPAFIPGFGQRGDADNLIAATYFFDHVKLSDQLRVLLGARVDYLDYEERVSGTRRDDTELSPMLGITWAPTEKLSLYANASQAFSPPSTLIVGEIAPEESVQVEIGAKRRFLGGRLEASLALYDLEKTNIAIPDQTGITRQIGDQSSSGVELEVAAVLAPGLRAFFSYAYTDAELDSFREFVQVGELVPPILVDRSGNVPGFAPENLANLWLSKSFTGGFRLSGGLRWVDDQFIDEDNAFAIDDYLTVDLSAAYGFGPWEVQVNLSNVTDEEYETRAFGNASVRPADPFAVYGGITYRR